MARDALLTQLATGLKQQAKTEKIGRMLVGAIILLRDEILLVYRSEKDDFLPGYVEIPGGKLETGEDIIVGMKRELHEETGLRIANLYDYVGFFDVVSPDGKSARQFNFLAKPANVVVRLSEEHSRYEWWNINELKRLSSMRMIDEMKHLLQKTAKRIKESPTRRVAG